MDDQDIGELLDIADQMSAPHLQNELRVVALRLAKRFRFLEYDRVALTAKYERVLDDLQRYQR